ncbi:hypothetical protein, partial [Pseudomonas aeruginosa]
EDSVAQPASKVTERATEQTASDFFVGVQSLHEHKTAREQPAPDVDITSVVAVIETPRSCHEYVTNYNNISALMPLLTLL